MTERFANDFETTLDGAIDDSQTTITVASVTGTPSANFRIRVDDEIMLVTGISSLDLTVERGAEGSTAAAHSSGAPVVHVLTAAGLVRGIQNILLPLDIPPASPSAWDDEFDGDSLDPKWTDPATSTSPVDATVADGWLLMEPSTAGSSSTGKRGGFGIRQDSPSGPFSVMAKVADQKPGDDCRVGIFVASTASSLAWVSGSQLQNSRILNWNRCSYSEGADWGASLGEQFIGPLWLSAVWYRIRWDGTTLFFDFSGNGVHWRNAFSTTASVVQPDRCGLVLWANSANALADHQLGADWFRVTEP